LKDIACRKYELKYMYAIIGLRFEADHTTRVKVKC